MKLEKDAMNNLQQYFELANIGRFYQEYMEANETSLLFFIISTELFSPNIEGNFCLGFQEKEGDKFYTTYLDIIFEKYESYFDEIMELLAVSYMLSDGRQSSLSLMDVDKFLSQNNKKSDVEWAESDESDAVSVELERLMADITKKRGLNFSNMNILVMMN